MITTKRHDCDCGHVLSLENTWQTNKKKNKMFAFILSIIEMNSGPKDEVNNRIQFNYYILIT